MDRRHRAILTLAGTAVMAGWANLGVARTDVQPSPAPNQNVAAPVSSPAVSATPWVQAAPPAPTPGAPLSQANAKPTPTATPKPAATPAPATPKPFASPATPAPSPKPTAARTPASTPTVPDADAVKVKMQRERERELNQSQAFEQQSLPRDEQTTFRNNARIWNKLLPEEKQEILSRAEERIRVETEQAYVQSGLGLNDDQREVFALRYRQERRRLERELLEKANNERSHRMPQILEQLKREFGKASAPSNGTPKPAAPSPPQAPPSPSAAVNAVPTPAPSPSKA